jgi:hypothetical protein
VARDQLLLPEQTVGMLEGWEESKVSCSLCLVTKKESFENTVNTSKKPHTTESPGESRVRVRQERLTPKDICFEESSSLVAGLEKAVAGR